MRRLFTLFLLAACLAVATPTFAQRGSADDTAVRKAIEDHYFKAQATGVGDHLKGTFVDEGRLMWVQDGQLRVRTSAEYISGFTGQPPADEAKRTRRVVMTDVTGDVAMAKVELDYPDITFIDYFTLAKYNGGWKIIHKSFHRTPKTQTKLP